MKSPVELLHSLLDDVKRLNPDVKGLDRDCITIKIRFENEGYGFLSVALPALGDAFIQGLSTGRFSCPLGFKRVKWGTIPRIFSGMFSEVFDRSSGQLKVDADLGVVKCLSEILRHFKKTQMSDETSDELDSKAVAEFFSTDEIARRIIIPNRHTHMLSNVCKFTMPNLEATDLATVSYKHGPGAVYEGLKANQKWSALSDAILADAFPTDTYGFDLFNSLESLEFRPQSDGYPVMDASRRQAKLVTVPKNSTSRRTITVEPLLNQFIQQGLNTTLRDNIKLCGILSNCLDLTDQSKNQQLALEGSLTDVWATLDLKSASDLLSVELVKVVFGNHPQFLEVMLGCRSTSVISSKGYASDLGKYAGMGNATTFPVQSIAFATICICAILDSQGLRPTYGNVLRASRRVRVFGDDIIIDSNFAHQAVDWLHDVGLKVNVKKSFLRGNFKESCGVDAFRGVDITPVYAKHRPDNPSTDPSLIADYVSSSNQCWKLGLYSLATKYRELVEERLGNTLPLVPDTSGGLGWHTRQNVSTPQKWNKTLHMWETLTYVIKSVKRLDVLDGIPALLKFFHTPLLGRAVGHLQKSEIRFKLRIVRRRVPSF